MSFILIKRILKFQILFVLFFQLFLNSCTHDHPCMVDHKIIDYQILEQISIPLEGNQYTFSHTILNPFDHKLYGLDPSNLKLTAFDLTSKGPVKTISFENQGPNALVNSGFLSFNFIGQDSVIFLNDFGDIFLFDHDGKKLFQSNIKKFSITYKGFDLKEFINLLNIGVPNYIHLPLKVDHLTNCFFAMNIWASNDREGKNLAKQYNKPVMTKISLIDKSQSGFFGEYPYEFTGPDLPVISSSSFEIGSINQKIILFNSSPKLWVDSTFYCVKSVFDRNNYFKVPKEGQVSEEKLVTRYHQDAGYKSVHYDKCRNLYYIIFKHEVRTKDPHIMEASFSIITLNEQFEILGECEFPPDTYDFLHVHVVPAGILLLKENPYYSKNLEEFLEADIIKIDI